MFAIERRTTQISLPITKPRQNADMRTALLSTGDRVLVEASPFDKIWGIGFAEGDPEACCPEMWRGSNLLGAYRYDASNCLRFE